MAKTRAMNRMIAVLLMLGSLIAGESSVLLAVDGPGHDASHSAMTGFVTAVRGHALEIDGKNVGVPAGTTIRNEKGETMELEEIPVNADVKVQFKQGRVESILVTHPR